MKRNKLEDKAAVKSSPKQTREIMTEKDNQEGRLISLGDKAASDSQEQPGREIMGDGNDIQEQNHEGKEAWAQPLRSKNPHSFQLSGDSRRETSWETRRQRPPRAKS